MLEISNIPASENEDLNLIITALANCIKTDNFSFKDNVDVAHRLKSTLKIPPIIVLFHSRTKWDNFYHQRKQLKTVEMGQFLPPTKTTKNCYVTLKDLYLGFQENNAIFVNESLTIKNAVLFRMTREACKKTTNINFTGPVMVKYFVKNLRNHQLS